MEYPWNFNREDGMPDSPQTIEERKAMMEPKMDIGTAIMVMHRIRCECKMCVES